MLERWLRFSTSWIGSIVALAFGVVVLWAAWGVDPDRVLFWALVGPYVGLLVAYEAFCLVQRARGADVRSERAMLASVTARVMREQYRSAASAGGLQKPKRLFLVSVSGIVVGALLTFASPWCVLLAVAGVLGVLVSYAQFLFALTRRTRKPSQ